MATEHPTPHDSVFKAILAKPENVIALLGAALPADAVEAFDPKSLREVKGSFVDEELRSVHEDVLYTAKLRSRGRGRKKRPALVYVLLEHQSTVDPLMPYRLLRYLVRIWEDWRRKYPKAKRLPAIVPIVLHQGPGPWDGPVTLHELLDLPDELANTIGRYVPRLEITLDDLGADSPEAAAALAGPAEVRLARAVLRAARDDGVDVLELFDRLAPVVKDLLREPGGEEGFKILVRYTVTVRKADVGALVDRVRRTIGEKAGEVVMSTAQELIEQGKRENARSTLEDLLTQLPGQLEDKTKKRLEDASLAELRAWTLRVVDAKTVADVFKATRRRSKRGKTE